MKTIFFLFITFSSTVAWAQQDGYCGLEKLFALKNGLSKEAIADSVKSIYGSNALNISVLNNAEQKESLTYSINRNECLNGNSVKLKFEFSNNKLVKAYVQTEFTRADYYQMLDNFNSLRYFVKQHWEREKETKFSTADLVSTGFEYNKPKQSAFISDKISLQYINTKPDKGYGVYLLQINWINSSNADIANIVY